MKYETVFFVLSVVMLSSPLMAESSDRVLFSSKRADAGRQWQTVNDGVMGGRSDGRIKINENKKMEFYGTLSLANNGGFASVRSRSTGAKGRSGTAASDRSAVLSSG